MTNLLINDLKDHIVPIMYGEENAPKGNDVLLEQWGDCYVGYAVVFQQIEGLEINRLKKDGLEMMGITMDELRDLAYKNLQQKDPVIFTEMVNIFTGTAGIMPTDFSNLGNLEIRNMYVLTTKSKTYGAAAVLLDGILESISDAFGTGVYILPSSVHECIILSSEFVPDIDAHLKMVRDINRSEVEPEERLSNSVYVYDRDLGRVRRYSDGEYFELNGDLCEHQLGNSGDITTLF